jgi:hypothetical protein
VKNGCSWQERGDVILRLRLSVAAAFHRQWRKSVAATEGSVTGGHHTVRGSRMLSPDYG